MGLSDLGLWAVIKYQFVLCRDIQGVCQNGQLRPVKALSGGGGGTKKGRMMASRQCYQKTHTVFVSVDLAFKTYLKWKKRVSI